jgi:hypothetical protein
MIHACIRHPSGVNVSNHDRLFTQPLAAGNAGWRLQFRFAVHAGWSRVPELWTLDGSASVKTLLKVLVAIVLLAILVIGGFMVTISVLHAKSRHQITQLVSEIRPGMAFSDVVSRLGRESQILTNALHIESYGTTKEASIVTNSTLHMFVHRTFIFYWICVYTDRDSQKVIYASWKDM